MKITYSNVKPFVEALKQAGRIVLVAIIPLVINQLNSSSIDWKAIGVTGAIALLMAIDKFLHLEGKVTGSENLTKGLTRF